MTQSVSVFHRMRKELVGEYEQVTRKYEFVLCYMVAYIQL